MDYSIFFKNVSFFGFHGWYPEEAVNGNQFEVDLSVKYSAEATVQTLDQTIDYAVLFELVSQQMSIRRALLETLGNDICTIIKNKFPQINTIELEIRKINPPIQDFKGVTGIRCSVKY
jgi:dihydroneopterin aldolase